MFKAILSMGLSMFFISHLEAGILDEIFNDIEVKNDLKAPENLNAYNISKNSVLLKWSDVQGEEGYKIYKNNSSQPVVTLGMNTTSKYISGLAPDTIYTFKVCSYDNANEACRNINIHTQKVSIDKPPVFENVSLPKTVQLGATINFSGTINDDHLIAKLVMLVQKPDGKSYTVFRKTINKSAINVNSYSFGSGKYMIGKGKYIVTFLAYDDKNQRAYKKFTINVTEINTKKRKVFSDFNKDGRSDVFWRDDAGNNHIWLMNKDGSHRYYSKVAKPKDYEIAGIGDFNGDGVADIFWRNGRKNSIWFMRENGSHKYVSQSAKPLDYEVAGIGDFNGDGIDDIFWRNGDGTSIWFMKKGGLHKYMKQSAKSVKYIVLGIGDFNGDGRDDILWRDGRDISIWFMNANGSHRYVRQSAKPLEFEVAGVGDFNGDGIDDILWRDGDGTSIWFMKKDGKHKYMRQSSKPVSYKVAEVGDFNGDGIDDIFWRNGNNNYLWFMNKNGTHKYKKIKSKNNAFITPHLKEMESKNVLVIVYDILYN